MAALSIQVPYPVFYDRDGQPLDNGNIFIGVVNLDPVTNPLQVYYDEALTIPASQPLKTSNGYVYRNGTPAQLYVNATNFSIAVKDSKNTLVYSFPDGTGISPNASGVIYNQGSAGAVDRTVQNRLQDYVSVKDFGAIGDGVVNDTTAIQAAMVYASTSGQALYFPQGTYICGSVTGLGSGALNMFGEAIVKSFGVDKTFCSPLGDTYVQDLQFEDFMIGFNFNNVAAGASLIFENVTAINCGNINTGGGRVDFQGFIHAGTAANVIDQLMVTNCIFDGDDFGICYRSPFDFALVTNCIFRNMARMGLMLGIDNSGNWTPFKRISITNSQFYKMVGTSVTEYEIHGILAYGDSIEVSGCFVDECRDIHPTIHDSEAIYLRGNHVLATGNFVRNGSIGDGALSIKGGDRATVSDNIIVIDPAWSALYGRSTGVYMQGVSKLGRAIVTSNQFYGSFDRAINFVGGGIASNNKIEGDATYGILGIPEDGGLVSNFNFTGNDIVFTGTGSAAISVRIPSGGLTVNNISITSNTILIDTAGNLGSGGIHIQVDRIASGARNTISNVNIEGNIFNGRSGMSSVAAILMTTDGGSGALGGVISRATFKDNDFDYFSFLLRMTVVTSADDIGTVLLSGGINTNTGSFISNPQVATKLYCRNVVGGFNSEKAGTATIAAGSTSVTVTMGLPAGVRPTSLDAISVTPTSASGAASEWWVDNLSADTFSINCDVAPGGSGFTFSWRATNLYYY